MPEELKPTMTQNFIHDFIDEDIAQGGQFQGMTVHTRFPPEPNGYLHIGHAKAIFVDFGTAEKYGGLCNLRMDDANPTKEDVEYVEAIQEDIHWLGYDWGDRFFFASDYFEKMYEYAVELIKKGLAYVCELTPEQFLFIIAIDEFKKGNGKTFPSWTDVLEVIRLLGYRKTQPSELNLLRAEDWNEPHDAPARVRPSRWQERFRSDEHRDAA